MLPLISVRSAKFIFGKQDDQLEAPRQRGRLSENCGDLDPAVASLANGQEQFNDEGGQPHLDRTLSMARGVFGRTSGELTDFGGRDHRPAVRSELFGGAGVRDGPRFGATDAQVGKVTKIDGERGRLVDSEGVTSTIYSVLGIDWTKKLSGAPPGRDLRCVGPMSGAKFIGSAEVAGLFA